MSLLASRPDGRGAFFIELRFAQLSNRTNNAIAAGTVAGATTAIISPGTLGVVSGSVAFAIPVIGQVLAAGTVAALAVNALPNSSKRILTAKQQAHKYDLEIRLEAALQRQRAFASCGGYPGLDETIAFVRKELACYA